MARERGLEYPDGIVAVPVPEVAPGGLSPEMQLAQRNRLLTAQP
jgi:hypothetical protein